MAGFHDLELPSGGLNHLRRDDNDCSTGGLYHSPAKGDTVNSLEPTNITWNPSCLDANAVDIHLYAPSVSKPRIHVWEQVKNADGLYEATLKPRWWNSSSMIQLQLVIVPTGDPSFLATLPAGPLWNATYQQPQSGTPDSADTSKSDSEGEVVGSVSTSKAISAGQIAAAVVAPIAFIALCIAAWLIWRRRKGRKERKTWTETVDQRMSTINADWPSVTVAGASAAARNSLVGTPTRASLGNRPSSSFYAGPGQAGVGAGLYHHENAQLGASSSSSNHQHSVAVGTGESMLLNVEVQDPEILTPEIIRARVSDGANWWDASRKDSQAEHVLKAPLRAYGHDENKESFREMLNGIDHTQTMGPDDMMRAYAYRA
ncbi:uncharacterized protein EV420DRAFT_1523756 [Desarmillaria tabescens]|uniref:Uncharacterized protein n=1 Tax=Armillaria tabescens TaxID=1929756 RepID=A0AA39NAW1_ARMTA|nr:uncharacterized protein EV420DRAFT_1523756 [Desarmillaria tabescens]KAK0462245.1 hypothetical protein EV420DRAFT_1523756 [Desarmillaria tabescens]